MGWFYNSEELDTKQDYIDQLLEINAYARLERQDFDFGTGLIVNEMSFGSEDAYYEMDIDNLADAIDYWESNLKYMEKLKKKKSPKKRPSTRYFKQVEKEKLRKLKEISWMNVIDNGDWLQRCYRGKRSAHLKRVSNRKIRRYKGFLPSKGNIHHKIFDFWWELY